MGRLRILAIPLILGAWGAATDGAPPQDAAPATSATRQAAPVPPIKYLEAGAKLFNSGQVELAAKYLKAAQTYRDRLTASEQTVLDDYLRELSKAQSEAASLATPAEASPSATPPAGASPFATPPAEAAAVAPPAAPVADAPAEAMPVASSPAATAAPPPRAAAGPIPGPGTEPRLSTTDSRQKARWLLQSAREQIQLGNYDDAAAKIAEARSLDVRWGLFDDTPDKVSDALTKARPKAVATPSGPTQAHNRREAKARLKEARALLTTGQFEQAEAIALNIKSWNLTYGLFEDNPDKVASAARALRHRDEIRKGGLVNPQPSQGVYDILLQEARQLMAAGDLDRAEQKARQAQRMNVVPSLTADRPEVVLHDVAMARARQNPGGSPAAAIAAAPAPTPSAEPASAVAEREANELLNKGDNTAAAAKFAEAERLRYQEAGPPAAGTAIAMNTSDPAIQRVDGAELAPAQALPQPALPAVNPSEAAPSLAPPASAPSHHGAQLLAEARDLFAKGNYPAARQMAGQVKASRQGLDAPADDLLAQVALAEQGKALGLYEAALDAIRKGDQDRARDLLSEVAASDGLDEGLSQKIQDLLVKLSKDAAGKAVATDLSRPMSDSETLAAQKLNAEVGTKIAEARRLQETDPDKAIRIYEDSLKAVKAAEIPEALARTMARRLEVALELAKKDKIAFEAKMQDKTTRAEIEQKRLRILEADKAKQARMKEMMDRATDAYAKGEYVAAEKFASMAQEIDPNEVAATILIFKAKMERRYKRDLDIRNQKEDAAVTAFQEADAASIANPEVQLRGIQYAKNFKDLTRDRLRINAALEPKKDPRTLAIEAKLKEPVSVNMDKQPLKEAIDFLANYTGLNLVLDPKALSDAEVSYATPVTLTASNISLKTALKLMLRPLGLTYKVEDEVLMITSPQSSLRETIPKTYYVGDLILPTGRTTPGSNPADGHPVYDPRNPTQPDPKGLQAQTVSLANGATSILGSGATASAGERPKVDMTPLIQLITATIAPGTWRVNDPSGSDASAAYGMGGGFGAADAGGLDQATPIGSITPFFLSISLIIRHTAEIHDQIADLLRQLRRLQDLQVSIEVRFITLSDTFFEYISVDFDFDIHSKSVGRHSTFALPVTSIFNNIPGGIGVGTATTTGGTATTGGVGATTTGGATAGGAGATTGATGGLGGQNGGGLGGLGGTAGAAGTTGAVGGSGTTGGATPVYIVNPIRDYALGNRLPITVGTQNVGANGVNFTPDLTIPFNQGSGVLAAPTTNVPGAGATFGIAFLSDLEVYLFLNAAQGDQRTNILQAPKVTTFNGAPASIINTEQLNFVSSLIPIVGPGSVAFLPSVQSFPNGVTLSVTPVVSADRRYVRMTLSPVFTVIEGFDTIQIPAAVGGSGLGGGSAAINGTIQLPRFNFTTVQTTVTVPDGGTVLLGGVKRLNEERKEFGVPVLSKTPLINRLFRNIGIGRVTSSLMLMVTPRIIILEEEEERLGIPTVAQ